MGKKEKAAIESKEKKEKVAERAEKEKAKKFKEKGEKAKHEKEKKQYEPKEKLAENKAKEMKTKADEAKAKAAANEIKVKHKEMTEKEKLKEVGSAKEIRYKDYKANKEKGKQVEKEAREKVKQGWQKRKTEVFEEEPRVVTGKHKYCRQLSKEGKHKATKKKEKEKNVAERTEKEKAKKFKEKELRTEMMKMEKNMVKKALADKHNTSRSNTKGKGKRHTARKKKKKAKKRTAAKLHAHQDVKEKERKENASKRDLKEKQSKAKKVEEAEHEAAKKKAATLAKRKAAGYGEAQVADHKEQKEKEEKAAAIESKAKLAQKESGQKAETAKRTEKEKATKLRASKEKAKKVERKKNAKKPEKPKKNTKVELCPNGERPETTTAKITVSAQFETLTKGVRKRGCLEGKPINLICSSKVDSLTKLKMMRNQTLSQVFSGILPPVVEQHPDGAAEFNTWFRVCKNNETLTDPRSDKTCKEKLEAAEFAQVEEEISQYTLAMELRSSSLLQIRGGRQQEDETAFKEGDIISDEKDETLGEEGGYGSKTGAGDQGGYGSMFKKKTKDEDGTRRRYSNSGYGDNGKNAPKGGHPTPAPTSAPTRAPTSTPTRAPTSTPTSAPTHTCDGTSHGCNRKSKNGGICMKEKGNNNWKCGCAEGYMCTEGCKEKRIGHRCEECADKHKPVDEKSLTFEEVMKNQNKHCKSLGTEFKAKCEQKLSNSADLSYSAENAREKRCKVKQANEIVGTTTQKEKAAKQHLIKVTSSPATSSTATLIQKSRREQERSRMDRNQALINERATK